MSEAVLQFTGRYAELIDGGLSFGHRSWEYQFWALYAARVLLLREQVDAELHIRAMDDRTGFDRTSPARSGPLHVEYLGHSAERPEGMASFFGTVAGDSREL